MGSNFLWINFLISDYCIIDPVLGNLYHQIIERKAVVVYFVICLMMLGRFKSTEK